MFSLYIIAVRKNNLKLICIPDSIRYAKYPGFMRFFAHTDSVPESVGMPNKLVLQVFFAVFSICRYFFACFCLYVVFFGALRIVFWVLFCKFLTQNLFWCLFALV